MYMRITNRSVFKETDVSLKKSVVNTFPKRLCFARKLMTLCGQRKALFNIQNNNSHEETSNQKNYGRFQSGNEIRILCSAGSARTKTGQKQRYPSFVSSTLR